MVLSFFPFKLNKYGFCNVSTGKNPNRVNAMAVYHDNVVESDKCKIRYTNISILGNISGLDSETIYATVQCSPDLAAQGCSDCLVETPPSPGFIAKFVETPRRAITRVQWLASPSGRLKLNTDAFFSTNSTTSGACLRNSYGSLIIGLCFPLA
nr:putative receptor-like protein kinase At4g00960 [Ipomoea batatas]